MSARVLLVNTCRKKNKIKYLIVYGLEIYYHYIYIFLFFGLIYLINQTRFTSTSRGIGEPIIVWASRLGRRGVVGRCTTVRMRLKTDQVHSRRKKISEARARTGLSRVKQIEDATVYYYYYYYIVIPSRGATDSNTIHLPFGPSPVVVAQT